MSTLACLVFLFSEIGFFCKGVKSVQVNYTIFEKKHHYMSVLKEMELMKRQMEYELIEDKIPKERLDEIYEAWDMAFAGLLREGLVYQYIQSASDITKDIVRLTIDNVDYDCPATEVCRMLKDDFNNIIIEDRAKEISQAVQAENQKESEDIQERNNEQKSQVTPDIEEQAPDGTKEAEQPATDRQNNDCTETSEEGITLTEEDDDNADSEEKIIPEDFFDEMPKENEQEANISLTDDAANAPQYKAEVVPDIENLHKEENQSLFTSEDHTSETEYLVSEKANIADNNPAVDADGNLINIAGDESVKSISTFIYDEVHVAVIPDGARTGEPFDFMIAPLNYELNNTRPDIAVYCTNGDLTVLGISNAQQKAVKINIDGQSFIIRGEYKNAEFTSKIYPADATLDAQFNLKQTKVEHRSEKKHLSGYGHIHYVINRTEIDVWPLSEQNDKNGCAYCLVVLSSNGKRGIFAIPENENSDITFNGQRFHLFNYWDNQQLISEQMTESMNKNKEDLLKREKAKKKEKNKEKVKKIKEKIGSCIRTLIILGIVGVIIYFAMKNTQIHDTVFQYVDQIKNIFGFHLI